MILLLRCSLCISTCWGRIGLAPSNLVQGSTFAHCRTPELKRVSLVMPLVCMKEQSMSWIVSALGLLRHSIALMACMCERMPYAQSKWLTFGREHQLPRTMVKFRQKKHLGLHDENTKHGLNDVFNTDVTLSVAVPATKGSEESIDLHPNGATHSASAGKPASSFPEPNN